MKKIVFLLLFSFITYSTSAQNGVIITKEQSIRLLKIFMNNNGTYSTCASTGNDFKLNIHYAIKVEKNARDEYAKEYGNEYYIIQTSQTLCNTKDYAKTIYRLFLQNAYTGKIKIIQYSTDYTLISLWFLDLRRRLKGEYSDDEIKAKKIAEEERKSEGQFVFKVNKTTQYDNFIAMDEDLGKLTFNEAQIAIKKLGKEWRLPSINELKQINNLKLDYSAPCCKFYYYMVSDRIYSQDNDSLFYVTYENLQGRIERGNIKKNIFYTNGIKGYKEDRSLVRAVRSLGNIKTDIKNNLNADNIANQNKDKSVGKLIDSKQIETRIYNYANGEKYEGNLKEGMFSGEGKYTYSTGDYYKGNWEKGGKNGFGIFYYSNGEKLEGNWLNDKMNGAGKYYYANGSVYEGNFKDNQFSGLGKITISKKEKFEGLFENDEKNGPGIYNYENGDKYEGNYKDGMFNGEGKYTHSDGEYYKGNWENDKQNGFGILYFTNGDRFEGNWLDGKQNGAGILYYKKGGVKKGIWKDGNFISKSN